MRRLFAVLAMVALAAACNDQPTAPDGTGIEPVVMMSRVAPGDRDGWIPTWNWHYDGDVRNFPCIGDMLLYGDQTVYFKYTSTGWGGLNIMMDHAYQPGFYIVEVADGSVWYPTFTAQPGHFQLKRDRTAYRASTELLENFASDDGTRHLKMRTHFSFDVAPDWDGTGLAPILFETYQLKVQACVVN